MEVLNGDVSQGNDAHSLEDEIQSNPMGKEDGPFGLIRKLASTGCFGSFPMGCNPSMPMGPSFLIKPVNKHGPDPEYETGGTLDKRRHIYRSPCNEVPPNQMSINTNYLDVTNHDQSYPLELHGLPKINLNLDEAHKTVEVGHIIGFEIENGSWRRWLKTERTHLTNEFNDPKYPWDWRE